jgi:hypothetical protein
MRQLSDIIAEVDDEKSFLVFVKALIADQKPHEGIEDNEVGFVGDWANNSISGFLEAAVAWAEDSAFGQSQSDELGVNQWKQFAVFLYCGKIYE